MKKHVVTTIATAFFLLYLLLIENQLSHFRILLLYYFNTQLQQSRYWVATLATPSREHRDTESRPSRHPVVNIAILSRDPRDTQSRKSRYWVATLATPSGENHDTESRPLRHPVATIAILSRDPCDTQSWPSWYLITIILLSTVNLFTVLYAIVSKQTVQKNHLELQLSHHPIVTIATVEHSVTVEILLFGVWGGPFLVVWIFTVVLIVARSGVCTIFNC